VRVRRTFEPEADDAAVHDAGHHRCLERYERLALMFV
jgi:hypothetical protein